MKLNANIVIMSKDYSCNNIHFFLLIECLTVKCPGQFITGYAFLKSSLLLCTDLGCTDEDREEE